MIKNSVALELRFWSEQKKSEISILNKTFKAFLKKYGTSIEQL